MTIYIYCGFICCCLLDCGVTNHYFFDFSELFECPSHLLDHGWVSYMAVEVQELPCDNPDTAVAAAAAYPRPYTGKNMSADTSGFYVNELPEKVL